MGLLIFLLLTFQQPVISTDTLRVDALAAYLPRRPANAMTELLPSRWVELITEASETECFLLCPNWEGTSDKCPSDANTMYFDPYASRASGGVMSDDQQATLKRIVLEPRNYSVPQSLGDTKGCITDFNIGYVLTVRSERSGSVERIILSICHSCSVMSVGLRGSKISLDIDYAKVETLELTKALFPDDTTIGTLYQRLRGESHPKK